MKYLIFLCLISACGPQKPCLNPPVTCSSGLFIGQFLAPAVWGVNTEEGFRLQNGHCLDGQGGYATDSCGRQ